MTLVIGYKLSPNMALDSKAIEHAVERVLAKGNLEDADKVVVITIERTPDDGSPRGHREWLTISCYYDFTPDKTLPHIMRGAMRKVAARFTGG